MGLLVCLCLLALLSCSRASERIVLLDETGPLVVQTPYATQVLTQPYTTATVRTDGQVQAGQATPETVRQRYGAVLASLPEGERVYTLTYAPGATMSSAEDATVLQAILADIAVHAACEVLIEGHTDTTGDTLDNDRLSLARAEAVRTLLEQAGMAATFVRVVGRGERALLVETADEVDEPRNRRVVLTVR